MALRIGTRGSALALAQAREVKARLLAAHPDLDDAAIEIVTIVTTGDRMKTGPLADAGGKGLFTKEIEEALLAGAVDLAVHSMKDVPTQLPPSLAIVATPEREDPRDALISHKGLPFADLPQGAIFATASLRRSCQIRHLRPDLTLEPLRGNVPTRLAKIRRGEAAATLLAFAGLRRLGLAEEVDQLMMVDEVLPAVAQGAIGIEIREADDATRARVLPLDHAATAASVRCERALLATLDGSCRTAIAALAQHRENGLFLRAEVFSPDGARRWQSEATASSSEAESLGHAVGRRLLEQRQA